MIGVRTLAQLGKGCGESLALHAAQAPSGTLRLVDGEFGGRVERVRSMTHRMVMQQRSVEQDEREVRVLVGSDPILDGLARGFAHAVRQILDARDVQRPIPKLPQSRNAPHRGTDHGAGHQ